MEKFKIFVSYSHQNEDWVTKEGKYKLIPWLERQLEDQAEIWTDHALKRLLGEEYTKLITQKIREADIVILLISQDFVSSTYIMDVELPLIRQQYKEGNLKIIPLLITDLTRKGKEKISWIFDLQTYPNDTKPLIDFANNDAEWAKIKVDILDGIENKIDELIKSIEKEKIIIKEKKKQGNGLLTSQRIQPELSKGKEDEEIYDQSNINRNEKFNIQPKNINHPILPIFRKKKRLLGSAIILVFILFALFFSIYKNQRNTQMALEAVNTGISYEKMGQYANALDAFQKAIILKPSLAEAYYHIGISYNNNYNTENAITPLNKAIKIKPNYADAYNWLGMVYLNYDKKDSSLIAFEKAISINPNLYEAIGNLYLLNDKNDSAIIFYKKAITIKPECAEIYNWMGNAYERLDKEDEAILAYQKALTFKPGYVKAFYNMGDSYFYMGDYDKAIQAYSKAIEIKIDYAPGYLWLGTAYYKKKEYDSALESFKKAESINPNLEKINYWIGNTYYYLKKYETAIEYFKKETTINTKHADSYYSIGYSYWMLNNKGMAKNYFKEAAKLGHKYSQEWLRKQNVTWE